VLGLLIFLFSSKLTSKQVASMGLLVVLVGFFATWVALVPDSHQSDFTAIALFCGSIALFRLMGFFERPR
jgi:hypothetical protein